MNKLNHQRFFAKIVATEGAKPEWRGPIFASNQPSAKILAEQLVGQTGRVILVTTEDNLVGEDGGSALYEK